MRDACGTTFAAIRDVRPVTYLDLEFFVNLHDLAEHGDVLHEAGKFPVAANLLQQARLLSSLFLRRNIRLRAAALSRSHCGGTDAREGRG